MSAAAGDLALAAADVLARSGRRVGSCSDEVSELVIRGDADAMEPNSLLMYDDSAVHSAL